MNELRPRHTAEILRTLRNGKFDIEAGELILPAAGMKICGIVDHWVNGADHRRDPNLFVAQGRDNVFNIVYNALTANPTYYVAPFVANVAIADNLTAATFTATQTEFLNYTSGTRVAWTSNGASASQTVSNSTAPAAFTINADTQTVRGVGLITSSAKSATTGFLHAASLFAAARTGLMTNDVLSVAYSLNGTSS